MLKAWFNALLVAWLWDIRVEKDGEGGSRSVWRILEESEEFVSREWKGVEEALVKSGWAVDVDAILVGGKGRVRIKNN